QSSGLLRVEQDGELRALERLVNLVRRDGLPDRDLRDHLLGTLAGDPLPWEAFSHLGEQAEIAAALLGTALARRETGVNILLYGPPGTGKTSFAASLAAKAGACLRPVAEAAENDAEPGRSE